MHRGRELTDTAMSVVAAATIVKRFAQIIVLRQPITSKTAPVRIRPMPLQTERTPTRETAKASGALTDRERSFAKLMTELPTAAKNEIQRNANQNDGWVSICFEVKSFVVGSFAVVALEEIGKTTSGSGFFSRIPAKDKTTKSRRGKV